jgi:hypothetical protein
MFIKKYPFAILDGILYRLQTNHLKHVMECTSEVEATAKLLVEYPGNYERPEPYLVVLKGKCTCPVDTANYFEDDCSCDYDFLIDSGQYYIRNDNKPMIGIELCQELMRAGFTADEILLIRDVSCGDMSDVLNHFD